MVSGYLTAPADVAEILKRFISHFFGCDVCRRNFISNYDNCGQNFCERLPIIMPALETNETLQGNAHVEFARWLMEMHYEVNVRLTKESAERQDRWATNDEVLAAMFPPVELCSKCWLDQNMTEYAPRRIVRFLQKWYWPENETDHAQFQSILTRNVLAKASEKNSSKLPLVGVVLLALIWSIFGSRRKRHQIEKTL
jgi:LPXTG-motif cell wall-anchored protein